MSQTYKIMKTFKKSQAWIKTRILKKKTRLLGNRVNLLKTNIKAKEKPVIPPNSSLK